MAGQVFLFGGFNDESGAISALTALRVPGPHECTVDARSPGAPSDAKAEQSSSLAWPWSFPLVTGAPPRARFGHSAAYLDGKLYIVGGCTGRHNHKGWMSDGHELRDVHVLDLMLPEGQAAWSQPAALRPPPEIAPGALARLHSCEVVGRTLLFFGGGPSNNITNALTALDVPAQRWRAVAGVRGRLPRKRMDHVSAAFGDRVFVFGGWRYEYELGDLRMLQIGPGARRWPAARSIGEAGAGEQEAKDGDRAGATATAEPATSAASSPASSPAPAPAAAPAAAMAPAVAGVLVGEVTTDDESSSESELVRTDDGDGSDDEEDDGDDRAALHQFLLLRLLRWGGGGGE